MGWVREFKELQSHLKEEDQQEFKDFEVQLGMPLEKWLVLFDGRGFFALSSGKTPDEPGFVGALGLANSAQFGSWWNGQAESYSEPLTEHDIDGVKFVSIGPKPPLVGYDDAWLYVADSAENAKKLMGSVKAANQGLDSAPFFKDGLAQIEIEGAGAFMFADISQLVKQAQEAKLPGTDDKTFTELSAFEYAIATVDFPNFRVDAFARVSGEGAALLVTLGDGLP